jgi:hypothetical protein
MTFNPTLTCSVVDTNATTKRLTGNDNVLIMYFSRAKATMSAKAYGGASMNLDMYVVRNGNQTEWGQEVYFDDPVESNVFNFSAEDSLGRVGTYTYEAPMIDYIKLTCNVVDSRPDGSGSMSLTCYGDCFNGSFGAESNVIYVDYRYKVKGGSWSSWQGMRVDLSGNKYYAYATLTGLDYQSSYEFEFLASDKLMTATTSTANVKSAPVFHWGEKDFVFEVPVTFGKDSHIKGNLRLKGEGNYGNYLRFGDSDYCYLAELEDDKLTIKASTINFDTNNLKLKGNSLAEYGTWTPEFSYGGFSYSSRSGWYCKVGNIVTVGFYMKATTPSGLEEEYIEIVGLPYDPAIASAGGGMLSNGLMGSSNKNFQCFVAETDGVITTRAQDCDSTASSVITTSAGGFRYPTSKSLTVSGTITYMTN